MRRGEGALFHKGVAPGNAGLGGEPPCSIYEVLWLEAYRQHEIGECGYG